MSHDVPSIQHLFISSAHNFVGHQGQAPGTVPETDHAQVELKAGCGIIGDRYFNHKPDYKGQITFFARETYEIIQRLYPLKTFPSSAFRRNIITSALDLNELIGVEFEMQGIRFAGTEEARPCDWMNVTIGAGARQALEGRGGLRARILTDGLLRVGPCDLQILASI